MFETVVLVQWLLNLHMLVADSSVSIDLDVKSHEVIRFILINPIFYVCQQELKLMTCTMNLVFQLSDPHFSNHPHL